MKAFLKKNKTIILWILYAVFMITILVMATILPDRIKKKNDKAEVISTLKCYVVDVIHSAREPDYVVLRNETGQSIRFSLEFQETIKEFDKAKNNNETIEISLRQIDDKQYWVYNGCRLIVESVFTT